MLGKKRVNAILYELDMTGYQKVEGEYRLERGGYNNYLINYTMSGSGKMTYGGREYALLPGCLTFINCADEHKFEQTSGEWEFVFLHVTGPGMAYLYDEFIYATGNVYENYDGKVILDRLSKIHSMLSGYEKTVLPEPFTYEINSVDKTAACDIAENVYCILTDMLRKTNSLPSDLPHNLKVAIDYIHENFTKKITLEQVARSVYLSKYHFERMFVKYTGKTFYEYVTQLRFERARLLLESTQKSLPDIAAEIGYADIQPLVKLFKTNCGVTPAEYRKRLSNLYGDRS